MQMTIKNKKEIAKGTLLVDFDVSDQDIDFTAGQYFFVTLIDPLYVDEKGNERHFTLVNSPAQKGIISMATRVTDSAFKRTLGELLVGSKVDLGIISGTFVLPRETDKPLVFIAGGIGITPYISMLRHIRDEKLEYKVTLIYASRDQESTAFLEELQNLEKENTNFKLIPIMSDDPSWKGETRRVDSSLVKEYFPDYNSNLYYVSGPPSMVKGVAASLAEAGVEKTNIKLENFPGYES